MGNSLTEGRLSYLAQSAETRRLLDLESRNDARQREQERQERLEQEYAASQKVRSGRLADEWEAHGRQHRRTGRLELDGAPVTDGQHLLVWFDGESIEMTVRYSYNAAREIIGCYADSEIDETFTLKQGMKAKRIEVEEPEPVGWHLKYKEHGWAVLKGELCAGHFPDLQDAQELCTLLQSYDKRQPSTDIIFRQV